MEKLNALIIYLSFYHVQVSVNLAPMDAIVSASKEQQQQ